MSRNVIIGIALVILFLIAGWYYLQSQKGQPAYGPPTPTPKTTEERQTPTTEATPSAASENLVEVQSLGFSPKDITVKVGESVTWINQDTESHQVNSAVHPTHLLYPPLNTVGLLNPGEKKSLSFPKVGTYKYHDHLNPSLTGSVTVE